MANEIIKDPAVVDPKTPVVEKKDDVVTPVVTDPNAPKEVVKEVLPAWVNPRIDQLTRKSKEAEEKLHAANAKVAELEAAAKKPVVPTKPTTEKPLTAEQIEKLSDMKANQKVFNQRCNDLYTKGKAELPGFDESVTSLNRLLDAPQLTAVYSAVLDFESPHELLFELSKNPVKIQELLAMQSAVRAGRELGKIADRIEAEKKAKLEAKPDDTKVVEKSGAPPPAKPNVDGKTSSNVTSDLYDKGLTGKAWAEARERDLASKAGQKRAPV